MTLKTSGLKFYTTIDLYFFKWEIIVCEKSYLTGLLRLERDK